MDVKLPSSFKTVKIDENVHRCNIENENEVLKWIEEYSKDTNSSWIVKYHATAPSRYLSRYIYACHRTSHRRVATEENKRGKSKNTNCKAEIEIKIKIVTKSTRKKDKYIKEGMPAIITFKENHNHSLNTAEDLSFLKPSDDIRETFEGYFNDGLKVAEAINFHESKLEIDFSESGTDMTNSSINPKYRTVQHWYNVWLKRYLGPQSGDGMIDKLKEKMENYLKEGITIEVQSEPFAVLVVTETMARAHEMPFSEDVVFVDSTAPGDAESHSVTFMLSPCSIGAAPLAVLITKGQSTEDYVAAFSLLKKSIPTAFKGQGHPKVFITDDSPAERSALNIVWPESDLLLCRFHLCQAVWRWLFEKKNYINKEHRHILYKLFKSILVASTEDLAQAAFHDAMTNPISTTYLNFLNYLKEYWERKELWCLAWRDATTHGHQTNNFSEVNVRLFKDIVLLRNKSYNVVSLVDFTCTSFEKYYLRRLRDFANDDGATPSLFLKSPLKKAAYIAKEAVKKVDEELYSVPKENSDGFYEVDASVGFCSCNYGRLGRFCKHQAAVFHCFHEALPNAPPVTPEARHEIAKIAFGKNAQPLVPFEIKTEVVSDTEPMDIVDSPQCSISQACEDEETDNHRHSSIDMPNDPREISEKEERQNLAAQLIEVLKSKSTRFKIPNAVLKQCVERANKIKTSAAFEYFISTAGALRHYPYILPKAISQPSGSINQPGGSINQPGGSINQPGGGGRKRKMH